MVVFILVILKMERDMVKVLNQKKKEMCTKEVEQMIGNMEKDNFK